MLMPKRDIQVKRHSLRFVIRHSPGCYSSSKATFAWWPQAFAIIRGGTAVLQGEERGRRPVVLLGGEVQRGRAGTRIKHAVVGGHGDAWVGAGREK